jgi:hypothetical protein
MVDVSRLKYCTLIQYYRQQSHVVGRQASEVERGRWDALRSEMLDNRVAGGCDKSHFFPAVTSGKSLIQISSVQFGGIDTGCAFSTANGRARRVRESTARRASGGTIGRTNGRLAVEPQYRRRDLRLVECRGLDRVRRVSVRANNRRFGCRRSMGSKSDPSSQWTRQPVNWKVVKAVNDCVGLLFPVRWERGPRSDLRVHRGIGLIPDIGPGTSEAGGKLPVLAALRGQVVLAETVEKLVAIGSCAINCSCRLTSKHVDSMPPRTLNPCFKDAGSWDPFNRSSHKQSFLHLAQGRRIT